MGGLLGAALGAWLGAMFEEEKRKLHAD